MKLIVHAGNAHMDEVLAAALASQKYPITSIERRNPTYEELDDPTILILDVGEMYEPALLNFDHHQLVDSDECAFTLLARHIYGDEYYAFSKVNAWMRWYAMMDTQGPTKVASAMGTTPDVLRESRSPVDMFLLDMFEEDPMSTIPILKKLGAHINTRYKETREAIDWIHDNSEVMTVKGVNFLIVSTAKVVDKYLTTACEELRAAIHGSVSKDPRGAGLALYRLDDHPCIDFTLIKDHPSITFAHSGGFIAKTTALDANITELLASAVTQADGERIAVWSDGEWCPACELFAMQHKSDDYVVATLPTTLETDEDIAAYVANIVV